MSDGALSQDEIDALLLGDSGSFDAGEGPSSGGDQLNDNEKKCFLDMVNKSLESQAVTLGGLIQDDVSINNIEMNETSKDGFLAMLPEEIVEVKVDFAEGLSGEHYYVMSPADGVNLAGPMIGQQDVELNGAAISAISEAMSQMMGSAVTKMGDQIGRTIMPSAADGQNTFKAMARIPSGQIVYVSYSIQIKDKSLLMYEVFEVDTVKTIASLAGVDEAASAPDPMANNNPAAGQGNGMPQMQQGMNQVGGQPNFNQQFAGQGNGMPQMQQGMNQVGGQFAQPGMNQVGGQFAQPGMNQMGGQFAQPGMNQMGGQFAQQGMNQMGGQMAYPQQMSGPNVQGVQLPDFAGVGSASEQKNIGLLMDVSMELTVELGRTRWLIKEILGMGEGTIVELDKLAGEPVDVLVNHNLIAKGEVVVIDENFGVRITEIVSTVNKNESP